MTSKKEPKFADLRLYDTPGRVVLFEIRKP